MQHGSDNDKGTGAESSGLLTRTGLKKTLSVTIIREVCGKEVVIYHKNTVGVKLGGNKIEK
jgi:hypothetical protein